MLDKENFLKREVIKEQRMFIIYVISGVKENFDFRK